MHKTLHKKLTGKHLYALNTPPAQPQAEDALTIARLEMSILRDAAKDLLQPRPEAIAYILKMSKEN